MAAADASTARPDDKLLTADGLVRHFGARCPIARDGANVLHAALRSAPPKTLAGWRLLFGKWAGRAMHRMPQHLTKLAGRYGIDAAADSCDTFLFALQTYYALLVNLVADRFLGGNGGDLLPGNPFSWCSTAPSDAVARLVARLTESLAGHRVVSPSQADDGQCDLFKRLYQNLFPRPLRHELGEYYTPDWLADHVLDRVGYTGDPGRRLLDPACGSGTFLLMALRRLRRGERGERRGEREQPSVGAAVELPHQLGVESPPSLSPLPSPLSPFPIVGFDLNPLAVLTARANYSIAIADLLPQRGRVEVPVYLCDSILGVPEPQCAAEPFDYVVGNPPWIAWDNLPDEDRQATKPLWQRYGLFSLDGNEARHGGGKKDLSMLMLYAAADRYLKPGGRLGMVVTQSLFQTKGAGDGFRRFRLGSEGPPLRVLHVDDMVALRPFGDAANRTSAIVLEKGAATEYPVPYFKWHRRGLAPALVPGATSSVHDSSFSIHRCFARPIDPARPNSPWLISPGNGQIIKSSNLQISKSSYTAHLGANSGGANGVYWVEVLDGEKGTGPICRNGPEGALHKLDLSPFLVRVRNLAARGKCRVETVEQTIEPDRLFPLLRWSDVRRWSAVPRGHIVLVQDPAARAGIEEAEMRRRYPRTLEYLERFHALLASRAAYRRYQRQGPFYAMYNVGPYTVAPVKVVWRRMDRRLNAAVVEETDDPLLGRRPVVPQETCVLVACDSADEAHYVCAVLNSAVVGELVSACSVCGGKGFGTPGMLEFVPLRRFRPQDPRHLELAALSRRAHAEASEEIQRSIDRLAAGLLS